MASNNSVIEYALLGFLQDGPLHGYELYQRLSAPNSLWLVWRIKQSRCYAMLDRLEARGYVTVRLELQESRPPRKMLHLTPEGKTAFRKWMCRPVPHGRQMRLEFMAKLFFAWYEGSPAARQLLAAQEQLCRQWLAQELEAASGWEASSYNWFVHQFRIGQIESMLQWLQQCAAARTENA